MKKLTLIALLIVAITGCKQQKKETVNSKPFAAIPQYSKSNQTLQIELNVENIINQAIERGWPIDKKRALIEFNGLTEVNKSAKSDLIDTVCFFGIEPLGNNTSVNTERYNTLISNALGLTEVNQGITGSSIEREQVNLLPTYNINCLNVFNGARYNYHNDIGFVYFIGTSLL